VSLLLDHNLSPRLIQIFGDTFGVVKHVALLGMSEKVDTFIWDYAKENGCAIVTKDSDFYDRSVLLGAPPKIIHITLGNCSVGDSAAALMDRSGNVLDFLRHPEKAYLPVP